MSHLGDHWPHLQSTLIASDGLFAAHRGTAFAAAGNMANILVVYSSKYGQTRKIAEAIQAELKRLGNFVDAADAASAPDLNAHQYDAVIAGAPVYQSSYPEKFKKWVRLNSQVLSNLPTAFFSVCLGILEKSNAQTQKEERLIVERFLMSTGWTPQSSIIFPGALSYRKYNWLLRLVMRRIAKRAGGDTDTSRNYEYTDWNEVQRFAHEFSQSLSGKNLRVIR